MRLNPKPDDVTTRFAGVLERIRAGKDLIDLDDVCARDPAKQTRPASVGNLAEPEYSGS